MLNIAKPPKYKIDDFIHLCRCKKRSVVALMWKNLKLVAYGVNHGFSDEFEVCDCKTGVRNTNCTHAEDMIFNVKDPDIYHGCVLEINWFPCSRCADNIIKHKVKAVCWTDGKHFESSDKLKLAGIECFYGTYEMYLDKLGEVQCKN